MSKNTLLSELINYISANSSGNVVIAAPSSGYALDVTGTGRFTSTLTTNTIVTSNPLAINLNYAGSVNDIQLGAGTPMRIVNQAYNSVLFYLNNAGNVGIGTSSPNDYSIGSTAKVLQVTGSAYGIVNANAGSVYAWLIADTAEAATGTQSNHPFKIVTNNVERMRINTGGHVLIGRTGPADFNGSTTPGYSFQGTVAAFSSANTDTLAMQRSGSDGNIMTLWKNNTNVGSISVTGSAAAYNTSSDYRLKEDLKSINGLEIINKINVYNYKWKSSDERMNGVLAHELQEVLPYAVTGVKDGEQMQSVDYSKIVPVLIQSIKEQQAQIEELKQLINN